MRVAIVINKLIACGAERLALDEVHELRRRGFDVSLITLRPEHDGDTFMPLLQLPDSSRHFVRFSSAWDIGALIALIRVLHREQYDLLITHLWLSNTVGRIAGTCAGVPRILSFEHNVYDTVKTWKQFLADRLLQRFSYKIIAVSDAVRSSLVRHGIASRRILVISNGIDLERYRSAIPARIDTEGKFTYLFAGRLVPQKAVDVLIAAFARLPDGLLLIAGGGGEQAALEALSKKLNVQARVRFLGVRDDIPQLMKAADCLILPSRWEGQGLVIPEAFASGLPVIISDFPAGVDTIEDGKTGIVVPREDPVALAHAMETIHLNTELRAKLIAAATTEMERFSIQRHVDTLLQYGI